MVVLLYDLIKYDLNIAAVKCNFYNRLRVKTENSFIWQESSRAVNCQYVAVFGGNFRLVLQFLKGLRILLVIKKSLAHFHYKMLQFPKKFCKNTNVSSQKSLNSLQNESFQQVEQINLQRGGLEYGRNFYYRVAYKTIAYVIIFHRSKRSNHQSK